MLISKNKYDAGDIIAFKLVNGDEVVARLESESETHFVLERPCTVVPSQQGLGLIQSLFSADQNSVISISKQHVLMHSPVIEQMKNHYIQTTTGIQPVTKGGIIT
jgi:hypothetical protein